jgi:hypothetical protein
MPWTVRVEDENGEPEGESFLIVELVRCRKGTRFRLKSY